MPIVNPLTQNLKQFAREIGVDLIGIAPADFDEEGEKRLADFVKEGRHGQMTYLENYQKRVRPQDLLPEAKSVIVIGINYYREVPETPAGHGRIARYAYGRDYHKVLKKILKQIAGFITKNAPASTDVPGAPMAASSRATAPAPEKPTPKPICKPCVDSAPLLEKNYAVKAGLGFIGKNTTLITPEFGSFVLLGELLTTLELDYDKPQTGTCGTCTRCLTACPTKAITAPGQLDARRCISYLTIENKNEIPQEFHKPIGNMIFGCDICQEVCPYNKQFARPLQLQALKEAKIAGSSIPLQEILDLKTDEEFLARFAGSPLMRAKRKGLQRNARIAARKAKIAARNAENALKNSTKNSAKNTAIDSKISS